MWLPTPAQQHAPAEARSTRRRVPARRLARLLQHTQPHANEGAAVRQSCCCERPSSSCGGGGRPVPASGLSRSERQVTAAAAVSSAEACSPERIIDCHVHFYDPWRPGHSGLGSAGPLRRVRLSGQCRALTGKHGVTGAVLVECSDPVEDNQWLLDMSDTDEFIVGVVGHVEPGPLFHSTIERLARHPRFVGVRPTPPRKAAQCSIEELRHLRDSELVLDHMVGPKHENINQFLEKLKQVPGLRVVLNHMGQPNKGDGGE
jgi:hypothetical protein